MPGSKLPPIPQAYLQRIDTLLARGARVLLGLVGPPGAGKSTLAEALCQHYGERAQVIPMDGFHLAQVELERLGRSARKGGPDTFDSAGYAALLRRLRAQTSGELVYAPAFRRDLEEPIAGAIAVQANTPLLIAEGNYLLSDLHGWSAVRGLLDDVWYVNVDNNLRLQRLVQRHEVFGRSPQAARDWVTGTDEPNARLIEASRHCAQLQFNWNE